MNTRSICIAMGLFLLSSTLVCGNSCAFQDSKKEPRRQSMKDLEPNDWESPIYQKLMEGQIDEVIVSDPWKGEPLWKRELKKADLESLVTAIQVNPEESGFHCMCDGDFHLVFKSEGEEVATIGYHHHRSIRWHKGDWKGDGLLTTESRDALIKWFDDRGFKKLSESYAKELARNKAEKDEQGRFTACFPKAAMEAKSPKEALAAFSSRIEIGVCCCKALSGISYKSWSATGGKERFALEMGNDLTGAEFLQALNQLDASDDGNALLGAARFFFWENYAGKIPANQRVRWTVKLAKTELNSGHDDNKALVMRRLASLKDPAISELLWQVARGQTGKATKQDKFNEEPDLPAAALLGLAELGDPECKSEIEKRLLQTDLNPSDKAALEVALVMLGDPKKIDPAHFERESYTIGLAAIRAVERFKGRHGLQVLKSAGTEHPWALVSREADDAVARLVVLLKKSRN